MHRTCAAHISSPETSTTVAYRSPSFPAILLPVTVFQAQYHLLKCEILLRTCNTETLLFRNLHSSYLICQYLNGLKQNQWAMLFVKIQLFVQGVKRRNVRFENIGLLVFDWRID